MAQNTKIEWAHHTANIWHGCTEVHAGCDNCYARVLSNRWGRQLWGHDVPRMAIASVWKDLDRYQKLAASAGEMHRVFVGSMMDIFEKPMPLVSSAGKESYNENTGLVRDKFFYQIVPNSPNLMFLLLTKRPSNINKYIPESWKQNPPANVMFGTSPVNQETADKLIPQLLEVNGKKFLSMEPLLGQVDLQQYLFMPEFNMSPADIAPSGQVDWIIVGGESGHGARPMHPDWVRSIRDQCQAAGTPFFFKQWGEYKPIGWAHHDSEGVLVKSQEHLTESRIYEMKKVGKKAAGRLLDGIEYNEFPKQ